MERKLVALIVRHGDTAANEANVYRSRLDPPLNKKGIAQAEKVSKYIKAHYDVYKIVCSPLLRAVQTADIIAEDLNLSVEQDRGLLCWNLGFMSGRDKTTYEPALSFFVDNPEEVIPDGESLDQLEERVQEFFEPELMKPWEDSVPLYITHTSDIITLDNLLKGKSDGKPEMGESTVRPGGLMAVFSVKDGFEMEPIVGETDEKEYAS